MRLKNIYTKECLVIKLRMYWDAQIRRFRMLPIEQKILTWKTYLQEEEEKPNYQNMKSDNQKTLLKMKE